MNAFVAGLIQTLAGAFIGAVVTLVATRQANENQSKVTREQYEREKQEREEQRQALRTSIRALLRNEIERNRTLLKEYWEYLEAPETGDGKLSMRTRAERLLQRPLLLWWHAMWEGQAQYLGTVLKPVEIVEAANFHAALDDISEQWNGFHSQRQKHAANVVKLEAELAELQNDTTKDDSAKWDDIARLRAQLKSFGEQFERDAIQPYAAIKDAIFTLAFSKGNPIGPDE